MMIKSMLQMKYNIEISKNVIILYAQKLRSVLKFVQIMGNSWLFESSPPCLAYHW